MRNCVIFSAVGTCLINANKCCKKNCLFVETQLMYVYEYFLVMFELMYSYSNLMVYQPGPYKNV